LILIVPSYQMPTGSEYAQRVALTRW